MSTQLRYWLWFASIGINLLMNSYHEPWSDEVNPFLVNVYSCHFHQWLQAHLVSGHPLLWNVILFLFQLLLPPLTVLPWLNVITMAVLYFILLFKLRLTPLYYLFVCTNYFVFYEYGAIARSSALFMVLLFYLVYFLQTNRTHTRAYRILVFFFIQIHFFASFLAIPIIVNAFQYWNKNKKICYNIVGTVFFSIGLLAWQLSYANHSYLILHPWRHFSDFESIRAVLGMPIKAFLPFPDFMAAHQWNTNFLAAHIPEVSALLGWGILVLPFFYYEKKFKTILWFYLPVSLLLLFVWLSPVVLSVRYAGFIFLFLFAHHFVNHPSDIKFFKGIFGVSLVVASMAGGYMAFLDFTKPFTAANVTAHYLQQHPVIFASHHGAAAPLVAQLQKPIYYPELKNFGTYTHYECENYVITDSELKNSIAKYLYIYPNALIVLNKEMYIPGMRLVQAFNQSQVMSEQFYCYKKTE